jgi:hypothetical protein
MAHSITSAEEPAQAELHVTCAGILAADEFGRDLRDFLDLEADRIVESTVVINTTNVDLDRIRQIIDLADRMQRVHDDDLAALRVSVGAIADAVQAARVEDRPTMVVLGESHDLFNGSGHDAAVEPDVAPERTP